MPVNAGCPWWNPRSATFIDAVCLVEAPTPLTYIPIAVIPTSVSNYLAINFYREEPTLHGRGSSPESLVSRQTLKAISKNIKHAGGWREGGREGCVSPNTCDLSLCSIDAQTPISRTSSTRQTRYRLDSFGRFGRPFFILLCMLCPIQNDMLFLLDM